MPFGMGSETIYVRVIPLVIPLRAYCVLELSCLDFTSHMLHHSTLNAVVLYICKKMQSWHW
jgi:hypothetical protein